MKAKTLIALLIAFSYCHAKSLDHQLIDAGQPSTSLDDNAYQNNDQMLFDDSQLAQGPIEMKDDESSTLLNPPEEELNDSSNIEEEAYNKVLNEDTFIPPLQDNSVPSINTRSHIN